jgi:hypothetical protein
MANENEKSGQQAGNNTPGQQNQKPGQGGQQGNQEQQKNPGQSQQGEKR